MSTQEQNASTANREMTFDRVYDAPRRLVFQAWTDPAHLAKWWGPDGFTTTTLSADVRPGGEWRFIMHGPDGTDYPNRIRYVEVKAPELLVYHHLGGDDPSTQADFEVRVEFAERGGQTELHMSMVFPTPEALAMVIREYGALEGAKQHLARLGEYVASM